MSRTSKIYLPRCQVRRRSRCVGLTLIEVIAGLALLGWLLSAVVLAKARYTRQLAQANRGIEAIEAADSLLASWWQDKADVPLPLSGWGEVPDSNGLNWRTSQVTNEAVEDLGAVVIRLEITDRQTSPPAAVLTTVDLVWPQEAPVDEDLQDPGADEEGMPDLVPPRLEMNQEERTR